MISLVALNAYLRNLKLTFEFCRSFALACAQRMRNEPRKRLNFGLLLFSGATAIIAPTLTPAQAQTESPNAWAVTIVMPPELVAGQLATLATLGVDGKLAAHVTVDFANGEHTQTDTTGRAVFTVPKTGTVLIARAAGDSVAALIDSAETQSAPAALSVAPVLSLHDRFSICAGGLQGDAEKNRVQINGEFALVLASSPECLIVAAGPHTSSGAAAVSVETSTGRKEASTAFVSFKFEPPKSPFTTGTKVWLTLRAVGSEDHLNVLVQNKSPEVIHFEKGDLEEVITGGGAENGAQIRVEAVRSGDFLFQAHLLTAPDPALARRFLTAAVPFAPRDTQRMLKKMASDLMRRPRAAARVRAQLQQIVSATIAGDLRTILDAARSAL